MRSKLLVPILIFAIASLFGLHYMRERSSLPSASNAPNEHSKISPAAAAPAQLTAEAVDTKAAPPELSDTTTEVRGTVEEHKTYVEKRIAELEDLAMDDDPKSLQVILSELTNRDPEIRQAAVDATVQFGSRDAIPRLADAALQTDDPSERTAILEAAEFLKLPSYRETAHDPPVPKPAATRVNRMKTPPAPASTTQ